MKFPAPQEAVAPGAAKEIEGQLKKIETEDCTAEPVPITGAGLPNSPKIIVQAAAAIVTADRSLELK